MTSSVPENSSLYPVLQNSTEATNLSTSSISYVNHNTIYIFSSPFDNPFEGIMAMLQLILCMLIFIGNSMTLFLMSVDKTLQSNIQNNYIMSLAAADQLVGTTLLQLLLKNYLVSSRTWLNCFTNLFILYTTIAVSMLNMLSIAVDRYLYIVRPFVHMRQVTVRRTRIIILSEWLIAAVYGLAPTLAIKPNETEICSPFSALTRKATGISHPIIFFIVCIGIGLAYGRIAKVARKHMYKRKKRIQKMNAAIAGNLKTVHREENETRNSDLPHTDQVSNKCEQVSKCNQLSTKDQPPTTDNRLTDIENSKVEGNKTINCIQTVEETQKQGSRSENTQMLDYTDSNFQSLLALNESSFKLENGFDSETGSDICLMKHETNDVFCEESKQTEAMDKDKTTAGLNQPMKHAHDSEDTESLVTKTRQSSITFVTDVATTLEHETGKTLEITTDVNVIPPKDYSIIPQEKLSVVEGTKQLCHFQQNQEQEQTVPWNLANLRWMKQMIMVFGLFFVCWAPCMVCSSVSIVYQPSREVFYVLSMLGMSNSAVNFFVYSLYNKTFRKAIKNSCRCRSRCCTC